MWPRELSSLKEISRPVTAKWRESTISVGKEFAYFRSMVESALEGSKETGAFRLAGFGGSIWSTYLLPRRLLKASLGSQGMGDAISFLFLSAKKIFIKIKVKGRSRERRTTLKLQQQDSKE